jgi:Spy/CpxP family protein refolding chaperone
MKKILIVLLLITTGIYAQRGEGKERIKALKTAHITEALDLTPAEAEKFWPVYNNHEDQMESIKKQRRMDVMSIAKGDMSTLNDSDANRLIDKMLEFQQKEMQLQLTFIEDIRKVLPPQKVIRLHRAEEDFKRQLVEILRKRRGKQ